MHSLNLSTCSEDSTYSISLH